MPSLRCQGQHRLAQTDLSRSDISVLWTFALMTLQYTPLQEQICWLQVRCSLMSQLMAAKTASLGFLYACLSPPHIAWSDKTSSKQTGCHDTHRYNRYNCASALTSMAHATNFWARSRASTPQCSCLTKRNTDEAVVLRWTCPASCQKLAARGDRYPDPVVQACRQKLCANLVRTAG